MQRFSPSGPQQSQQLLLKFCNFDKKNCPNYRDSVRLSAKANFLHSLSEVSGFFTRTLHRLRAPAVCVRAWKRFKSWTTFCFAEGLLSFITSLLVWPRNYRSEMLVRPSSSAKESLPPRLASARTFSALVKEIGQRKSFEHTFILRWKTVWLCKRPNEPLSKL